ncbi:MAG TPA: heme biosynthesis HemY N-terminal domain-containing protein [Gammaproteobacteria bacterium]
MRLGFWALAALFVGAFAAHFLLGDQGYVLIHFRGYVVEMSVPALVLAFALVYVLIRALKRLWRAPRALGEALAGRSSRKAGDRLTAGLMYMTEGNWTRGERLLTQGVKNSSAPLVNYLMAARAAHEQDARERRNEWLKLACEALPEAEVTILLTQAEMQYEDGELEQALATLQRIQDKEGDHRAALALTARTKIALDDRAGLVELLPRLARAKLPTAVLAEIAAPALEAAGARAGATYEAYMPLWSGLPAPVRQTPAVLRTHALALNRLGHGEQAATELAAALKRDWHAELVRTYGEVKGSDPLKQLRKAEEWLKAHPDDGVLLMTAARLCMLNELWGKARSYLESSLALAPNPDAYALYGNLLDRLGEREQAALAYHSGLALAGDGVLSLPALGSPPAARRA